MLLLGNDFDSLFGGAILEAYKQAHCKSEQEHAQALQLASRNRQRATQEAENKYKLTACKIVGERDRAINEAYAVFRQAIDALESEVETAYQSQRSQIQERHRMAIRSAYAACVEAENAARQELDLAKEKLTAWQQVSLLPFTEALMVFKEEEEEGSREAIREIERLMAAGTEKAEASRRITLETLEQAGEYKRRLAGERRQAAIQKADKQRDDELGPLRQRYQQSIQALKQQHAQIYSEAEAARAAALSEARQKYKIADLANEEAMQSARKSAVEAYEAAVQSAHDALRAARKKRVFFWWGYVGGSQAVLQRLT